MRTFTLVMGIFNLEIEEYSDYSKFYNAKCVKVGFSTKDHYSSIDSLFVPFCVYLAKKNLTYRRTPSKLIYKGFTLDIEYTVNTYLGVCKEINFEKDHYIDDLVIAFLEKVDEYLVPNFTHKGYKLVVEPEGSKFWKGDCQELGYHTIASTVGLLHLRFIQFVDNRKEEIMKNQFSIVFDEYILKVTESTSSRPYRGVCKELDFDWGGFCVLNDLIEKFLEKAKEKELQPEIVEYGGYRLTITREKVDNAWFVGRSTLGEDWLVASASKEYVEKCFIQDVDELESEKFEYKGELLEIKKILRKNAAPWFKGTSEKWELGRSSSAAIKESFKKWVDKKQSTIELTAAIKGLQANVSREQKELREFLEKEGYVITVPVIKGYEYYPLYAVHPEYYEQWKVSSRNQEGLPYHAVVFIGEN